MQKPDGYDGAQAATGGQRPKPPAGGHVLGVVRVEETKSRDGEEMIVLYLDIARGEFKNYYRELGERLKKDVFLRYYQLTQSKKSIPFLKGMIQSFEKSNPGFDWQWEAQALTRRLVGANLREEEYENKEGKRGLGLKIVHLCSIESVDAGLPILAPKLMDGSFDQPAAAGGRDKLDSNTDDLPW